MKARLALDRSRRRQMHARLYGEPVPDTAGSASQVPAEERPLYSANELRIMKKYPEFADCAFPQIRLRSKLMALPAEQRDPWDLLLLLDDNWGIRADSLATDSSALTRRARLKP